MKQFLKYTFATIVGVLIAAFVLVIIASATVAGLVASAGSSNTTAPIANNSVFVINLSGELVDYDTQDPIDAAIAQLLDSDTQSMALCDLLSAIDEAANNDKVKGIYLYAGELTTSPASLQELRNALLKFKESGKFIVSYGDTYHQGAYYLCSVADHIVLNPQGSIEWMGMAANITHYKELLDKIGVGVQVFKVGTYKSAVEPYIQNEMSDANREQITAYLNSIWGEIVAGVAESRAISADDLNRYADEVLTFSTGDTFINNKMADTLLYKRDVREFINVELLGVDAKEKLKEVTYSQLKALPAPQQANTIAVYYAQGEIYSGSESTFSEGIYSNETCKALRKLADDDNVAAVVLRINSPGGSAYASEQIWNEIEQLKARKPVVVSMGGVAASGGYYIACGADKIVAEPTTITGSIGIFGLIPNFGGLYDKIGLHSNVVTTNKHAAMLQLTKPFDGDEQALLQGYVDAGYELFVGRCAAGRGMTTDAIKAIAEGRVWTGEMALELGLVDTLGGIDTAIALAAEAAELDEYQTQNYPVVETDIMKLLMGSKEQWAESRARQLLGERYTIVNFIRNIEQHDRMQARLPYTLSLNL